MKKPNLLFFGIDSLRRDRMSLYGYKRLTTPHIDNYLKDGVVFENCFSTNIPTTSGYSCMLTGLDSFGTGVVALRHQGQLAEGVKTLPEILRENGYNTTCIGFSGNAANRGFDKYLDFDGWGSWEAGRSPKAENLNAQAIPELERLAAEDKPFMLFLRHMDPHSPYLAPAPFERMFYSGDEFDPRNKSLEAVYDFKPFRDYFYTWFPPGCTDVDYIIAQYDAEIAYMDSCIQILLQKVADMGLEEDTLVVFTSDHGETLNDHDCYFDHHGLYDCTLVVPFAFKFKGRMSGGSRHPEYCTLKDVTPTILKILGIETDIAFDGRDLTPLLSGGTIVPETEYYITEATWQRKHGWRTPRYKYFTSLEPDFHYKPKVELYDLQEDPGEHVNIAELRPEIVAELDAKMMAHIAAREKATGRKAPIYACEGTWHGMGRTFTSSDDAYNSQHIGDPEAARKLQDRKNR